MIPLFRFFKYGFSNLLKDFFVFSGRITRYQFWSLQISLLIVSSIFLIAFFKVITSGIFFTSPFLIFFVSLFIYGIILIQSFANFIRRFRDLGYSPFLYLLVIIVCFLSSLFNSFYENWHLNNLTGLILESLYFVSCVALLASFIISSIITFKAFFIKGIEVEKYRIWSKTFNYVVLLSFIFLLLLHSKLEFISSLLSIK